jgi:hypothetical protein
MHSSNVIYVPSFDFAYGLANKKRKEKKTIFDFD